MTRIEEIDLEIEKIEDIIEEKETTWNKTHNMYKSNSTWKEFHESWEEFRLHMKPENDAMRKLMQQRKMIMPYTLRPLSEYGDVMSLENFIECVKDGGFIDYDGFGRYVIENQETDIEIYPSDVKNNAIRPNFDTIIWFNR